MDTYKVSMVTLTRKVQVFIDEENEEVRKSVFKKLHDLRYQTYKAANLVVNTQYSNFLKRQILKNEAGKPAQEVNELLKQHLGTGTTNIGYREIVRLYPDMPSMVATSINTKVVKAFNSDMKEVLSGKRSIRNYKLGMPIPFNIGSNIKDRFFRIEERDGVPVYTFSITKAFNFKINFGKDKSGNRIIIDRIIAGEYVLCDSEIKVCDKTDDYKIYFLFTYKHEKQVVKLDKELVLATNLGMNCPLYFTTSYGYKSSIGTKEEFWRVRNQFRIRRSLLQKALVNAKSGKGIKRKLAALDRLKDAEKNFAKTYNHKLSKAMVMYCLKNGIGTIKTEELLGSSEEMNQELVLSKWGYFQLQTMIKYKADMYGIDVVKVNPEYISQKCNCCKNIDKSAIDFVKRVYVCKQDNCNNFNKEVNVDENASLNVLTC